MLHTWKLLGLNLLLATSLAAAPTAAGADTADAKKLDEIKEELKGLSAIKEDLKNIQKQLELSAQAAIRDSNELREKISRLEKQLKDLETRLGQASARTAYSSPVGTATGRIRLINSYVEPTRIRVNDRVYPLEPGQTLTLDNQPVGGFTYEVLGIQGPLVRVLGANETYTIYVYPR
jgi:hypothetical protein